MNKIIRQYKLNFYTRVNLKIRIFHLNESFYDIKIYDLTNCNI